MKSRVSSRNFKVLSRFRSYDVSSRSRSYDVSTSKPSEEDAQPHDDDDKLTIAWQCGICDSLCCLFYLTVVFFFFFFFFLCCMCVCSFSLFDKSLLSGAATMLDLLFSPCMLQRLSFCCYFPFLVLSNYTVCYLCVLFLC